MTKYKNLEDYILSTKQEVEIPINQPVVFIKNNIFAFPSVVIPLYLSDEISLRALEYSIEKTNRLIFIIASENTEPEKIEKDFENIGVIAQIMQMIKLPDNSFKVLVEGIVRAETIEYIFDEEKGMYSAKVEVIEPKYRMTKELKTLIQMVKEKGLTYFSFLRRIPPEALKPLDETEDPVRFTDYMSSLMPLNREEKQELLNLIHPKKRLELLLKKLIKYIEIYQMEENLEKKVRGSIEQSNREFYLREKIKTIKEELKDEDDVEIKEYKEKLEKGNYPENVKEKIKQEITKLEQAQYFSSESTVMRNYIDWLLQLPWNEMTEDKIDIKESRKILEGDHYGLEEVKERMLEYLAAKNFSKNLKSPILCLVGPPGVGKTSLGNSLARAMKRKFVRMSLGGIRDEAEIRGHRRTYVGALPGRIIQLLKTCRVKNPVIMLDEIDKMGQSLHGDPASALLEVLDPEQNNSFTDHYIEMPFDLSQVIFITTANVLHTIPPALLDRMETIEISGYTNMEKMVIAEKYIIPKILEEYQMEKRVDIETKALEKIINEYTKESGVRKLQRVISSIVRKSALKILEQELENYKVTAENVSELLGPEKYIEDEKLEKPQIGISTGLAWTAVGGTILQIETNYNKGKGTLIITGQLGDIMKESAQIAYTIAKKYCEKNVEEKFFEKTDFHIHVPEGAVPKDGPSAGITITTSMISAILSKPVRNDIAMTGEITLRGKVLPIGGIKEKSLAAYKIGIKEIIIPFENKKDLVKIPEEIKEKIKFHLVKDIDEVLKIALGE